MTSEAYEAVLARIQSGESQFTEIVKYIEAGDCVRYVSKNRAYNGVYIDPYVTLYVDRRDGEPVGFKVKCVRTLVAYIRKRGHSKGKPITFSDILNVVEEVEQATEKARAELQRAKNSNLGDVELPEEALA